MFGDLRRDWYSHSQFDRDGGKKEICCIKNSEM